MKRLVLSVLVFMLTTFFLNAQTLSTEKRENMMKEMHQQLGIELFNTSWDLLLKPDRNREDEDILLNTVHASLYHWRQVGQPLSILRGEWMICHVYTLLGHKDEALYHAENVMRLKEELNPQDWDLAYCYEAMARVMALRGDRDGFTNYYAQALQAGKSIKEEADRKQFDEDMHDSFWFDMLH